ncbi:MAG: hypothetical protein GXP49_02925 [Deltaproteobacteria bacterium]|nr:hypothetical protein [Deltaproteobacteria bacterium]
MAAGQVERRKSRRSQTKDKIKIARIQYFLLSDPKKRYKDALMMDLGSNGLRIATNEELPLGATIEVHLFNPKKVKKIKKDLMRGLAYYRLLAQVRWAGQSSPNGYMHGLEFLDISIAENRNRKGIEDLISELESK